MLQVVFVPGILGCTMLRQDDVQLWPPIAQIEVMDLQTRVIGLLDPTTRPGSIIDAVHDLLLGSPEYGPVMGLLAAIPGVALHRFVYDWRKDVRQQAVALAALVAGAATQGSVVVVAHSMGGLLARYMLEAPDFHQMNWFASVKQLVVCCTPHLGAPLALFRVLGLDGIAPVVFPGWVFGRLASNPALYPAAHQMLPPASESCVTYPNGGKRDVFSAVPGLDPIGTAANAGLFGVLGRWNRPPDVLYRLAYGHGHFDTVVGVQVDPLGQPRHQTGDGDGTVPAWSGQPAAPAGFFADILPVLSDHVGVLNNPNFTEAVTGWVEEFRELS